MASIDKFNECVLVDFSDFLRRDGAKGPAEARSYQAFPFLWMRDNCQCPECAHPHNHNRTLLMRDLLADVTPKQLQVSRSL